MDILDKKILTELTKNCRATYNELSEKVGFTANAVKKRIEKLIDNGTLYSFTIRPSLRTMNANIALALIETDGQEMIEEFLDTFDENEMVGEVNPIIAKEGGFYLVISDYINPDGLMELGSFFRRMEHIRNVEMHPVLTDPVYHGEAIEFKPLELRVMRYLVKDARMSIVDLARDSGLSARRVRSVIENLQEGGGLCFSVRWNTAAAGAVRFFLKIEYDPRTMTYSDVVIDLRENYPREFWLYWASTHTSHVFGSFTVDSIEEVRKISIDISKRMIFKSINTWVCYPPRKFKTFPEIWLENLLESS